MRSLKSTDGRQPDAQQPTGRVLSLRQVRLCFGKLVQGTPAALQEQIALIGEVYAAGGAMEQARAQVLLEAGDALAHRRRGQAEDAGGTDDAARLRSADEGEQGRDGIHAGMIAEHQAAINVHRASFSSITACPSSIPLMDGGPHGPGFDAPLACPCAAALDAACRLPGRAGVAVVLLGRRGRGAGAGPFRGGVTHCAGLGDQCVHAHLRQPVARRRRPGRPPPRPAPAATPRNPGGPGSRAGARPSRPPRGRPAGPAAGTDGRRFR
ncbi:hypothetical protein G6F59_013781 [Rhizopus arrhizus]|nr:hypothetical protein G6F59_013781 [Rhizopus arrhizus]